MRFESSDSCIRDLFLAAFEGGFDDDAPCEAITKLRLLGSDEVFALAVEYSESALAKQRARALDVLAQLGSGGPSAERPHVEESISIATVRLSDPDPVVVHSAAWALAHLGGGRSITRLVKVRNSSDAGVRLAVAFGLAGNERPEAIAALMELMEDIDDTVRDWATFGLGAGADSPAIREALRKRLDDSFDAVRNEALWALALRGEEACVRELLERLEAEEWLAGDEMAASEILGTAGGTPVEELRRGLRDRLTGGNPV